MKKSLLLAATLLLSAVSFGQIKLQNENQDIELPKPMFDRYSKSMIETLMDRHSVRDFEHKELSMEDLSTLCWAACGRSRDENHITSPTAMNRQEIRLYVFLQKGVYEYIPGNNVLQFICQGDYREMFVSNSPVAESSKADKKGKGGKNGKELKALELPGLWNGAMSDWSTIFVEVPLETFNPVKTVNDLLRPQHQG